MNIPKRIVGEVTKNWPLEDQGERNLLCQRFEAIIAVNAARGFELESWQLTQLLQPSIGIMTETIIAVFVERADRNPEHSYTA